MKSILPLVFMTALIAGCSTSAESLNPDGVEQIDPNTFRVRMLSSGIPIHGHASSEAESLATSYCKKRNQQMKVMNLYEADASSFIPGREAELTFACVNARGTN
jgi:hypothetical protein